MHIDNLNKHAVIEILSLPDVIGHIEAHLVITTIVLIITISLPSSHTYVQRASGQESTPSETLISGENLDLTVMPELPISQTTEDQNMIVIFPSIREDIDLVESKNRNLNS